jgi:hypothetical protein
MKQSVKTAKVPQATRAQPKGPLQTKADQSAPVAKLTELAAQANAAAIQGKFLIDIRRDGRGRVKTKGASTSLGFDRNHLVAGDVTSAISEQRAIARNERRNTVVQEAQLLAEITNKKGQLFANARDGKSTRLNFSAGTAYQTLKASAQGAVLGTADSATVDIDARLTSGANNVLLYHIKESEFAFNAQNDDEFPELDAQKKD